VTLRADVFEIYAALLLRDVRWDLCKRKWRLNATFRPGKSIIVCNLYSAGCTQSVVVIEREREREREREKEI
jgi:hypothetical protein